MGKKAVMELGATSCLDTLWCNCTGDANDSAEQHPTSRAIFAIIMDEHMRGGVLVRESREDFQVDRTWIGEDLAALPPQRFSEEALWLCKPKKRTKIYFSCMSVLFGRFWEENIFLFIFVSVPKLAT
jgi:hypothetical protein